ncbi:uncharacterized protein DS421_4g119730 [Arachis hypogaea]|nr:uncharacterized protein DS421_4g119730 [Arachis hypogaea]
MMKLLPTVDAAFASLLQQERQLHGTNQLDQKPLLNAVDKQANFSSAFHGRDRGRDNRSGKGREPLEENVMESNALFVEKWVTLLIPAIRSMACPLTLSNA